MATFLSVLHIFTCVILVLVVLVQSGKDGGMGMVGGGSSQTVFGSSGGANFFTKFTSGTAVVFMVTSIILTVTHGSKRSSVFANSAATVPATAAPAAHGSAPQATASTATTEKPSTPSSAPAAAAPVEQKK